MQEAVAKQLERLAQDVRAGKYVAVAGIAFTGTGHTLFISGFTFDGQKNFVSPAKMKNALDAVALNSYDVVVSPPAHLRYPPCSAQNNTIQ